RDAIQISRDGRYIAFDNGTNVYRWDGTTTNSALVNQTTGGTEPTNGTARLAGMTPDGNGIAFVSDSPDLTPNGSSVFQIYARDMTAGVTRLVSAATNGQPSTTSHETSLISLAGDSPLIAFDSTASDLVSGDGNRASDVFVRDLT